MNASVTTGAPAQRYAVAGHPVEHSRSPAIHARFAQQTGERIEYGRLPCPLDGFAATVRAFASSGDGRTLGVARGCNVTVPFKFEALSLAATLTDRAQLAGAVNTLRFDEAGWAGDNTDGIGLVRDVTRNAGIALEGKRVLLVGAGGASAGVLGPLIECGCASIAIANRTLGRARALVERHADWARRHGVTLSAHAPDQVGEGYDVVVNGTAASLAGDAVPVPDRVLGPGAFALDMMYGPPAAGFLAWARERGATARDGLGMLVEQAGESFWFWRGVRPDTAPVLAALRAEVDR